MIALNRYKILVSSVFKSRVLLEQTSVFRGLCSVPKARCCTLNVPVQLVGNVASCHNQGRLFTCHIDTQRCFSELYNGNNISHTREEEPHEMDSGNFESKCV